MNANLSINIAIKSILILAVAAIAILLGIKALEIQDNANRLHADLMKRELENKPAAKKRAGSSRTNPSRPTESPFRQQLGGFARRPASDE